MSEIKSVGTIQREVALLNEAHAKMIDAADKLVAFFYSGFLFTAYSEFHSLLSAWANSLITVTSSLPDNPLPYANQPSPPKNGKDLPEWATQLRNHEFTLVEGLLVFLPNVFMYFLAYAQILPWLVAVLYSVGGVAVICAPSLIEWYLNVIKSRDEDTVESENPTEWITHDIQFISDRYDAIRFLILKQDVKSTHLPDKYKKVQEALYSRAAQEQEIFPTECQNVVRKIMVFCNHAYYEQKDRLISKLPTSPRREAQPLLQVASNQ